jgi:hypothetical protein
MQSNNHKREHLITTKFNRVNKPLRGLLNAYALHYNDSSGHIAALER